MNEAESKEVHLLDYWRVLVKRRWVVYTCLAISVTTVMLRSLLMEPVYTATATLQIERRNPNVLPFQRVTPDEGMLFWGFYETQYGLITSRRVARDVIRTLDLDAHPEFAVGTPSQVEPGLSPEEVAEGARISILLASLSVSPISKSRLVNISYSSHDRALAAKIANTVAETYIEFNTQAEYNTTEQASESLAVQAASLQGEIEEKEKKLQAYAREHGIIPINETQDITLKNLTDLSKSFTEAKAVRIEREARFEALREADPADIQEVAESRVIEELSAKKVELLRHHAQLSEKYGPEWPEIARVKGEIEETDRGIARERAAVYQQVLGAAEADYRASLKQEAYLGNAIDELRRRTQELSLKEIEYRTLKAEIENRRATLEAIQRRQSEAHTSAGMNDPSNSNVRIVDRAEPPVGPSKPRLRLNFLLSLVGGLGLGVGLAFFFEYLDKSVKSGEEIRSIVGIPALGSIPVYKPDGPRLRLVKSSEAAESALGRKVGLISHEDPAAKISEAVREIRTSLLVSRPGGPPRTILIASSQPDEGKTCVCANLAISLAQMGRKVLLVDADMRKPRQHWLFELANDTGLSNALSGPEMGRLGIQPTRIAGLDLLPSGPPPPNPGDLLNSKRFAEIEQELASSSYDHVIFDSPPILAVTDACIVAGRMDSVVIVAWAGVTGRDALAHSVGRLRQVKAVITGAVLNKAEPGSRYYGRYSELARYQTEAPEARAGSTTGGGAGRS